MGRHPLDPVSLVAGLAFVVLGTLWFAGDREEFVARIVWLGPALLVGVGLVLVATTRNRP